MVSEELKSKYHNGIDISFYVDNDETPYMTDFNKMKSEGIEFLIIRAGQNTWEDPDFQENWERSKGILPRGAYYFLDDRIHPNRQAELYYELLKGTGDLGELPVVVDFEKTNYWNGEAGQYAGWQYLYTMLAKLMEYMPEKDFIVYTGYYFWKEQTQNATEPQMQWFKDNVKLWIANYNDIQPEELLIPYPFEEALIWQASDKEDGNKYGVESKDVDFNLFLGSDEEWEEFLGDYVEVPPTTPPNGGEEDMFNARVVATAGVNIRSGAGTEYPKVEAAIPYGTELIVDEMDGDWWHITSIAGATADGWSVSVWYGEETLRNTGAIVTPPPVGSLEMTSFTAILVDTETNESWTQSWQKE